MVNGKENKAKKHQYKEITDHNDIYVAKNMFSHAVGTTLLARSLKAHVHVYTRRDQHFLYLQPIDT